MVIYSGLPPAPDYQSWGGFDPRGMEHVYLIVHTFLDLILRDNVLPRGLNTSQVISAVQGGEEPSLKLAADHWQDLLLQYIGVLTIALFGIFLALLLPVIGFFFCCCRCAGRCGAYLDTHYDKKSDRCKRVSLGIFLSFFVIAVVFGTVSAFVTNQYTYSGWVNMREKVDSSLEDAGGYFQHTGESINVLLVNNFAEMEEVIGEVLDDSGPILKRKLADITEAIAIDDLTAIVSGLGKVKKNLNSILNDTRQLDDKVSQLRDGLARSQTDLSKASEECTSNAACASFLADYDLDEDLAMAEDFINIEFKMPEVTDILIDISSLIDNDIEEKVKNGKNKLDSLEGEIEDSIEDIKPKVKSEIREMGVQLQRQNSEIQQALRQINDDVASVQQEVPEQHLKTLPFVMMRYYLGLGMASTVLLILVLFILGLFYGMCGRRPGGLYGDDCCNRGTGASFLVTAVYFTFLFSLPILLLTALHFLLGASLQHGVCNTLRQPARSDVFLELDRAVLTPRLADVLNERPGDGRTALQVIQDCHANHSLYNVLGLEKFYNISSLNSWRSAWGLGSPLSTLGSGVDLDLKGVVLLPKSAEVDLKQLSKSPLASLNLSQFSSLEGEEVTVVDIQKLVRRLRTLREQVGRREEMRKVANDLELEVRYLDNMVTVGKQLSLTTRRLLDRLDQLDKDLGGEGQASLGATLPILIELATKAEKTLRTTGESLVDGLANQLATEAAELVDAYVRKVESSVRKQVGACAPLSEAYNATITAVCSEVVEPFNGFWASIGWCYLLYLPCILLSVSLIKLYRKTESYPGPVLEAEVQPLDGRQGKVKRRGHRRTASSMRLPEFTHSRALPALPPDEEGQAPPRYSSNPSIPLTEYERPPPYYFPNRDK